MGCPKPHLEPDGYKWVTQVPRVRQRLCGTRNEGRLREEKGNGGTERTKKHEDHQMIDMREKETQRLIKQQPGDDHTITKGNLTER